MSDRATPKPERKCVISQWRRQAMRTAIKACAVAAVFVVLLEPFGALANYYERGNWICDDFADMEQTYRSEPENIYFQRGYAGCLITRGDDSQGMAILHDIVDHNTDPARVGAAWQIANYLSSGGTFGDKIDENNINAAIEAYGRVVFFIRLDPDYPFGNDIYEEEAQIELKSHYRLPLLYFYKFNYGLVGTHNMYKLKSPSYNGDGNLNTYLEYDPYTIDSIEKTIEFANQCLALPRKRHFIDRVYEKTMAKCQVFKNAALALLPLERERLVLLDTYSCSDDLIQCDEYNDILKNKINPVVIQADSDIDAIIEKYDSQK